jgi:hypothetical protein
MPPIFEIRSNQPLFLTSNYLYQLAADHPSIADDISVLDYCGVEPTKLEPKSGGISKLLSLTTVGILSNYGTLTAMISRSFRSFQSVQFEGIEILLTRRLIYIQIGKLFFCK